MKGSLKIATLAGIDIYIHVTFFILLAWLGLSDLLSGYGMATMAASVLTVLLVFGIIVLHEMGHALAARRFGIRTERITLLPIGGVASMERIPEDPRQELVVALAGPAVNVGLATLAFLALAVQSQIGAIGHFSELLPRLFWTNVVLALFNMIPAFPMDGGRVLRAFLSLYIDRVRATRIAATLGQVLAILFGLAGFFVNPMLILVALFVWTGARAEANDVQMKAAVRDVRVGDVMVRHFRSVTDEDSLGNVGRIAASEYQTTFPVLSGGQVMGVVDDAALVHGLATLGEAAPLLALPLTPVVFASPGDSMADVLASWQASEATTVVVLDHGNIVGMLTADILGAHLALTASMGPRRTTAKAPSNGFTPI